VAHFVNAIIPEYRKCFFLEFQSGDDPFNIMIDCGPRGAWCKLQTFLDGLIDKNKKIDLLILTHFDSDHIEGALAIFNTDRYRKLVREVWHNGLEQISPALERDDNKISSGTRSAFRHINQQYQRHRLKMPVTSTGISYSQSMSFSMALKKNGYTVNTNPITDQTDSIHLGKENDIVVDFLLPKQAQLDALLSRFASKLKEMEAAPALAEEAMDAFEALVLSTNKETYSGPISSSLTPDTSITNAASIAIVIRFHGYKFLFSGDAIGKPLSEALLSWQTATGESLQFDVVKLPHHGSARNCPELLNTKGFGSKTYLISTNGKYGHPGNETIEAIKQMHTDERHILYFNYPEAMNRLPSDTRAPTPNVQLLIQDYEIPYTE
jgi:hypothetical protein